ncbi:MAG: DUF177 domain-containing protein, partial [Rikenellaceae bacterium]|nr:DUF177 domain-containing protein [Rikenellaceae bacterium]
VGKHDFEFELDGLLFRAFDSPDVKDARVRARVTLTRAPQRMSVEAHLDGVVTVECDRCLEDLSLPVEFDGDVEVTECTDEWPEEGYDGEAFRIAGRDGEIDLSAWLFESVILALPYRRVHDEGGCDPAMLERFRVVTEEEFDRLAATSDPPKGAEWEKLRKLMEETK